MSTEATEQPEVTEQTSSQRAMESFRESLAELNPEKNSEEHVETPEPEVSKETKTKEQKTDSEFPESLLEGVKVEEKKQDDFLTAEPPPEIKGKARENFKRFQEQSTAKIQGLQAELEKTQAEFKALKESGVQSESVAKELETLRAERQQLNDEIEKIAFERSPKFRQQYIAREDSLKNQALKLLKSAGVDETLFEQAVIASEKKKFELLSDESLSDGHRSALASLLIQYDMLQEEKNQALSKSKEYASQLAQEEESKKQAEITQFQEKEKQVFTSALERISKTYEPFTKVEGNEAWNKQVETNVEVAKKFFSGQLSWDELAEMALYGSGAKTIHHMFKTVQTKLNEANAEIKRLKSASPSVNGHTAPVKQSDPSMSREQRAMNTFNEELSKARGM